MHAVLEHADPEAPDLRAELLGHIDDQLGWWPVDLDREELADALVAVCDSPLGPLVGTTLREIPLADRLREMDFELPAVRRRRARRGHRRPPRRPGARCCAATSPPTTRSAPTPTPLVRRARRAEPARLPDRVGRRGAAGARRRGPRYLVVDYKTNWLGGHDEPLTAASYRPEALAAAMGHSDYPLQALLYAAVLHRFLRWRQPDYDPERHLGGVLYLYLRGMCGPETPVVDGHPCGVFSWRPPVALRRGAVRPARREW